jgi:hypothetical protein
MNMGVTLATYATICHETGRPFLFPGSPMQWNGLVDITDARLLALHLEWAATAETARDQAFNSMADMVKSRKAGFFGYQDSRDSFFDLFDGLQ